MSILSYRCTRCGERQVADPPGVPGGRTAQMKLTVKRVMFMTMGAPSKKDPSKFKLLQARVVDWLCDRCLAEDPEWEKPGQQGIPTSRAMNARRLHGEPETKTNGANGVPKATSPAPPVLDEPST